MDTKETLISMIKRGSNKVTLFNFAFENLKFPEECRSERQKRHYCVQYINFLIKKNKEVSYEEL